MTTLPPQAEYIVGCRGCGNHCMVVERDRSIAVPNEVVYSDGYIGGWQGVQTDVVTCPSCGLVMSWRKNCQSAALLRQAGDLERFKIEQAFWGPPKLYWAGFDMFDSVFHPARASGDVLPRLQQAPAEGNLLALRKRAALARGLLWLGNDQARTQYFFGGTKPARAERSAEQERRHARLLRALVEFALFGGEDTEANALELAEWHRELGDWLAATRVLDRHFADAVLADRARQLQAWVDARNAAVLPFEELAPQPAPVAAPAPTATPEPEPVAPPVELAVAAPVAAPEPAPAPPPARKAAKAPTKSPRMLLETLLEVLGTLPAETLTRDYIPRPYGALVRGLMKSHGWDEDSFAVSVIRGFARQHGWPQDVDPAALAELESFGVDDDELLGYLAAAFKKASWDEWAFEVPKMPAPKRGK